MLQVGLRADLRQLPFRKLAAQEQAEAFAEYQAGAALARFHALAPSQIEQEELAFAAREALHGQGHARAAWLR